jgi:hypothetical protein
MDPQPGRSRTRTVADEWRRLRKRLEPVHGWIRSRFEVDTRALAALRIALGLIILIDLVHRAGDIALFYTDAGVYPRSLYESTYPQYTGLSLHAASGDPWFQQFLFVLAGILAVALVLGYRTRLAAFVSLVLLYSLHARNPAVLNGADRLLRVLLLVALVTPLGERWSADALRRGRARTTVASLGTAALLVQPLAVFTSNAIRKHRGETWYSGEALQIAFANDAMTILLGNHLAAYPALLEVLNWAWVILLSGSVLFLLLTGGRVRALFALAYVGAFAGMIVTMAVGLFPLVLIASVIAYLTTPFWETVARLLPSGSTDGRPTAVSLGPLGSRSSAASLGPLAREPAERRVLDALRERGHGSAASFAVDYARSLSTVIGFLVLVWILLYTTSSVTELDVPPDLHSVHLDQQHWGLYAPDPSESYSWYVVEAELDDGTTVDGLDGGEVDLDRPPDAAREYDTFRHRKYMETVRDSGRGDETGAIARRYAEWACEQANREHDGRVERVRVHWLYQPSPLDGEPEDPWDIVLVERDCDSDDSRSSVRGRLGDPNSFDRAAAAPSTAAAD